MPAQPAPITIESLASDVAVLSAWLRELSDAVAIRDLALVELREQHRIDLESVRAELLDVNRELTEVLRLAETHDRVLADAAPLVMAEAAAWAARV